MLGTGKRNSRFLLPASLSLVLGACSFAPDYVAPQLPVPERFPGQPEQPMRVDRISAASTDWRQFFSEDPLQRLIARALENNRDIRIAAARVEQARAAFRIQGSALYPQLDAGAYGTRSRTPADLSFTGSAMTRNQIYAQFSAGWEIDFWGRLANMREAARQQYLATEEGRRAVAVSLISQLAAAWLVDSEYGERIALTRRSIATREESLRIMRRRYEVGSGSMLEVTQARTLLGQAQLTLHSLQQERGLNRNALLVLVGEPVELGDTPLQLAAAAPGAVITTGLPSALLENRPDILAAEHQLRAANADIGAARAAFFPNISLTGAYGTASGELDDLFGDGSEAWSFTPSITLPLFNAGRNAANLDLSEARQVEAVAAYEQTVQQAFRDVADALVARRQLLEQIETTRSTIEALEERARLAQLRFDNGRSAYLEVLDAQRDLFDARQGLVQLRRAYLASGVALYAALGGGIPTSERDNS